MSRQNVVAAALGPAGRPRAEGQGRAARDAPGSQSSQTFLTIVVAGVGE